jgi:hypothetical protein
MKSMLFMLLLLAPALPAADRQVTFELFGEPG